MDSRSVYKSSSQDINIDDIGEVDGIDIEIVDLEANTSEEKKQLRKEGMIEYGSNV